MRCYLLSRRLDQHISILRSAIVEVALAFARMGRVSGVAGNDARFLGIRYPLKFDVIQWKRPARPTHATHKTVHHVKS